MDADPKNPLADVPLRQQRHVGVACDDDMRYVAWPMHDDQAVTATAAG